MDCEASRQILLDLGLTEAQRRDSERALQHVRSCGGCQAALEAFDALSDTLRAPIEAPAPPSGWKQFDRGLIATLAQSRRPRAWPWRLGIAASLILTIAAFELGRQSPRFWTRSISPIPIASHSVPREATMSVGAFEELSKVYDGHASWVLVSKNTSDIGFAKEPLEPAQQLRILHLTMSRSASVVSDADLLILPGQTADVNVPLGGGKSLHYLISTPSHGPADVSLRFEIISPESSKPQGTLATTLAVKPGQQLNAGELATASGNYQLNVGFSQKALASANP